MKDIYGIYNKFDLLKMNSFILAYKLYIKGNIDRKYYTYIKEKTSDLNISYLELKKLLEYSNIYINSYNLQNNDMEALNCIETHIEERFSELEEILTRDSRVTVTFPGKNALLNNMIPVEVENVWRSFDKENYDYVITRLNKLIIILIQLLQKKFHSRIKFGPVSDREASEISYQVWPADMGNWNLPMNSEMKGDGYALYFDYQKPGVFGIVTNPRYGYKF